METSIETKGFDPKVVLKNEWCLPSSAWKAYLKIFGNDANIWEPDTIRLELARRSIVPTDSLMAKILGAQTITTTFSWTYDHSVLFSFALACDGIPANYEQVEQPTPEQLCLALHEIQKLVGKRLTEEEGFDPDTIDPAIAVVLHHDGFVLAPEELSFVQEHLDNFTRTPGLKEQVKATWDSLKSLPTAEIESKIKNETAVNVQIAYLLSCRDMTPTAEEADRVSG